MKLTIEKFRMKYYQKFRKIYINSFPRNERFPIFLLLFNVYRNNSELYVLLEDDNLCGFIYLINYKNMTFILYLAVREEDRNKGYGSYILKWCLKEKKGKNIYLNIEEVNKKLNDYLIRKKRLEFYLSNGVYLTDYLSSEPSSNFNILSTSKKIDVYEYRELDKKISKWFLCKNAKIIKKDE